jgi:probable rRNA maturation factor
LNLQLVIDRQVTTASQPTKRQLQTWVKASLQQPFSHTIVNIAIVNATTSQTCNLSYRNINSATNIIALEYVDLRQQFNMLTGDLIFCEDIIVAEATQQQKQLEAHYVHLCVHGMLHLQGYDHQCDNDASVMEALEIAILATLDVGNPYLC